MTKRTRTLILVAAVVVGVTVAAYAGLIGYLFLAPVVEAHVKAVRFDSAKWKARSLDGDRMWPTRLRMADDLVDSKRLARATRQQVEELLGPPDETEYFKDWSMVYWLGPERGTFRIDSEWLVLRLNESGVVAEFELVRD